MSRSAIDMVMRHIPGIQDPFKAETPWYLLLEWSSSRAQGRDRGHVREAGAVSRRPARGRSRDRRGIGQTGLNRARSGASGKPSPRPPVPRGRGSAMTCRWRSQDSRVHRPGAQGRARHSPVHSPYPLGHIGDGNLHFSFMGPKAWISRRRPRFVRHHAGRERSHHLELGGSISAEHGIGIDKLDELTVTTARKTELDIMRTIKPALDPQNIMNLGQGAAAVTHHLIPSYGAGRHQSRCPPMSV